MARTDTFSCTVITPERAVLECDASFVAFPAHDGEMGVLRDRAPLLCKLGIGVLRVETAGDKHVLFIDGGFAQVVDNRLTILTEQSRKPDEIDPDSQQRALVEARAMTITDDASAEAKSRAISRAKVQLKLVKNQ